MHISHQPLIQGHSLLGSPMTDGIESIKENWISGYSKHWSQNFGEAGSEGFSVVPDEGKEEGLLSPAAQLHLV